MSQPSNKKSSGKKDKGYPFNEINKILKDAKDSNHFMNYGQETSNSHLEEEEKLPDKYFQP